MNYRDPRMLRAAALCLVAGALLVMAVSMAYAVDDPPPSKICGDVNGDAKVTASDALRVLHKAVGLDPEMRCNNRRSYGD